MERLHGKSSPRPIYRKPGLGGGVKICGGWLWALKLHIKMVFDADLKLRVQRLAAVSSL
jgi:hypothetical protein